MSDTINTQKRFDAHWKQRDCLFHYRATYGATYTGTGDQNYMFQYVKINECLLKMWMRCLRPYFSMMMMTTKRIS